MFLDLGFDNFKFFFRGSHVYTSYVEDLKKVIVELGLQNFVEFEPFISKITLDEIYSKFDLVILLSEYEGFGLPVLEAQSYSIPVACSGIEIFREVLQESVFYLSPDFNRNDIEDFVKQICNQEILDEKIKKGLNNVKRFSWYEMSHDTLSLYKLFTKKV